MLLYLPIILAFYVMNQLNDDQENEENSEIIIIIIIIIIVINNNNNNNEYLFIWPAWASQILCPKLAKNIFHSVYILSSLLSPEHQVDIQYWVLYTLKWPGPPSETKILRVKSSKLPELCKFNRAA